MDVAPDTVFFREFFKPRAVVAFADEDELQIRPGGKETRQRGDEGVHAFVSFIGEPAANGEDDPPLRKTFRKRSPLRGDQSFELGIKGPRKNANFCGGNFLHGRDGLRRAMAGREDQPGFAQGAAAEHGERFGNLDAVGANDGLHARGGEVHGVYDGREIGMRGQDELGVAPRRPDRCGGEACFGALRAGEDELAISERDAMKFGRIVEREETRVEATAGGELLHDGGDVAAGALHAAGGVEFRKQANEHGVSLPSAVQERKEKR